MGKIHTKVGPLSFFAAMAIMVVVPLRVAFAESVTSSHSQTLQIGSTGADTIEGVAFTSNNNQVVSGTFSGTVNFNVKGGTQEAISAGSTDAFLAKYDSQNNLEFLNTIGTTTAETVRAPFVGTSDNIYITGSFSGTVDFDPSAGTDDHISNGSTDVFVSKYSSDGSYLWTVTFGGTGGDSSSKIIEDQYGVYIAGRYAGAVDFDPGAGTASKTSTSSTDPYILKLTNTGSFVWVNTVASGHNDDGGQGVATDSLGNVYFSGFLRGTSSADFDPGAGTDTRAFTGYVGYLSKYDKDAGYIGTVLTDSSGTDATNTIAIDSDDNVYTSGQITTTADFDPGAGTYNITSAGGTDVYLSKFDSSFTWQWSRSMGGTGTENASSGVRVDSNGNPAVFFTFTSSTVDLNKQGTADSHSLYGSTDAIMSVFSSSGTLQRSYHLRGSATSVIALAQFGGWAFDSSDNVYVSGNFTGIINVGDSETYNITSAGSTDGFLTKVNTTYRQNITVSSPSITFTEVSSGDLANTGQTGVVKSSSSTIRMSVNGLPVAQVIVDITTDRDWSSVTGAIDVSAGKSVVVGIADAPGAGSTHTLFVPYISGASSVGICPNAVTLDQVTNECAGMYTLTLNSPGVQLVTISGQQYWQIDGLSGTGGFNIQSTLASTGTNAATYEYFAGLLVFSGLTLLVYFRYKQHRTINNC